MEGWKHNDVGLRCRFTRASDDVGSSAAGGRGCGGDKSR